MTIIKHIVSGKSALFAASLRLVPILLFWQYHWNANGSLKEVIRPDRKKVAFAYDALGRRIQKTYNKKTTRWVWDGNTPLHEWEEATVQEGKQPEITTWVFDEGSFSPAAKLIGNKSYSIVTDYLGTPVQAYDETGKLKWETELDIYGKVRTFEGDKALIPFRYQGQYEDAETGLYYNRFRYYSPDEGMYLSQDPIGLAGGNPTIYGYISDSNAFIDPSGLIGVKKDTPAWEARGWQGSGDYPGTDSWRTTTVKKGTVVYGGVPGQSEFYLSKESLEASGGIKENLWESVQVKPHDKFGYRSQVQAYEFTKDAKVGKSIVKANPQFGKGGATQFFVKDFKDVLKPIKNPINLLCRK